MGPKACRPQPIARHNKSNSTHTHTNEKHRGCEKGIEGGGGGHLDSFGVTKLGGMLLKLAQQLR